MEISGCEIQSRISLDKNEQIFYLINNVKKYPARFIQKTRTINGVNQKYYSFISYTKNKTSYEDQGFYQCGITIPGPSSQTILSKTTDVQFSGLLNPLLLCLMYCIEIYLKSLLSIVFNADTLILFSFNDTDVAASTVDIRMDKIWNKNLKNSSSDDFRRLERAIIKELQDVLPNEGGSKPIIRVLEFK